MVCDFLTLFSVRFASSKPSPDYPYGFGKVETIGSLTVSSILTMAGISIGWSSLCVIVGPIVPHALLEIMGSFTGHSHGSVTEEITNVNAAWVAAASVAAKEWIFRATRKVAIETNSNVLMANAWHHRVDSLTSLVALVTITSGYLFNIQSLDAVGGLIVSGLVIKAGVEGMVTATKELTDQALEYDDPRHTDIEIVLKDGLNTFALESNSKYPCRLADLTVLPSGPNFRVHAIIQVPEPSTGFNTGIKDMEVISSHLRSSLSKNISSVKRLNIEYISKDSGNKTEAGLSSSTEKQTKNIHMSHSHKH